MSLEKLLLLIPAVIAQVLEGMHGLLANRSIDVFEFEWGGAGSTRNLSQCVSFLDAVGYGCFYSAQSRLVPISGACYRDAFADSRGNIVCGRRGHVFSTLLRARGQLR